MPTSYLKPIHYLHCDTIWRQEEKGTTDDEMVGWRHWLNRHEFKQVPGEGEGQGRLLRCSSWDRKGSDTTEWTTTINLKVGRESWWSETESKRVLVRAGYDDSISSKGGRNQVYRIHRWISITQHRTWHVEGWGDNNSQYFLATSAPLSNVYRSPAR